MALSEREKAARKKARRAVTQAQKAGKPPARISPRKSTWTTKVADGFCVVCGLHRPPRGRLYCNDCMPKPRK